MAVHIGNIIKELVKAKGFSVEDFSTKINYTRRNAYKIFDKPSIDTDLLQKINKVLGENLFFKFIKDDEVAAYTNEKIKSTQLLDAFKNLESTVIAMIKQKDTKAKILDNKPQNTKKPKKK